MEPIKVGCSDPNYPQCIKTIMGKKAPKYLYMLGNRNLLNLPSIGFCGARKASPKGLEIARDCAEQAVKKNIAIISGNAIGVDCEVHYSALASGGKTILVLPEGINRFYIKKALESVWNWDNVLVISQFEPDDPWKIFRAMIRSQLIIALSRVMIVIEASEKGGTFMTANETLKLGLPLFVAEYRDRLTQDLGSRLLLDAGGQKLKKSRSTDRANLKKVFAQVENGQITGELL